MAVAASDLLAAVLVSSLTAGGAVDGAVGAEVAAAAVRWLRVGVL